MKSDCGHNHDDDLINKKVSKLDKDEIFEHRYDLIEEISYLARQIASYQKRVWFLGDRADEVELELEAREAKESGKMN
jgi:hypothetical protein